MRRIFIVAIALCVMGVFASSASAHTIPKKVAQKAANQAGQDVANDPEVFPGAEEFAVGKCKFRSAHRWDCPLRVVGTDAESGLPYGCTSTLVIKTKSRTSYSLVAVLKGTRCELIDP